MTCLYRFYDNNEGYLLGEVAHISVEHYATRDDALLEERRTIGRESPKYNVTHNNGQTGTTSRTILTDHLDKDVVYAAIHDAVYQDAQLNWPGRSEICDAIRAGVVDALNRKQGK